jgi:hypothetical protein
MKGENILTPAFAITDLAYAAREALGYPGKP